MSIVTLSIMITALKAPRPAIRDAGRRSYKAAYNRFMMQPAKFSTNAKHSKAQCNPIFIGAINMLQAAMDEIFES